MNIPDSSIPPKLRLRTSILVAISTTMVFAMMGWGTMRLSRPSTLPTAIVYNQVNDTFTVETRPTPWWSIELAPEVMPFYTIVPNDSGSSSRVEGLCINKRFVTGTMGTKLRSEAYKQTFNANTLTQAIITDSSYNMASDRDDPRAIMLATPPPAWAEPSRLHCTNGNWSLARSSATLFHNPNAAAEPLAMTIVRSEPTGYESRESYYFTISPSIKMTYLSCGTGAPVYQRNWFKRKYHQIANYIKG